jgi:hypothetical protein
MNVDSALDSYTKQTETPLCKLFTRVGCDKGPIYHYYSRLYQALFEPIQNDSFSMFEMGIGTVDQSFPCHLGETSSSGTSLRAWTEFFPHAKVYAADIDSKTMVHTDRIQTFVCDQTSPQAIQAMWNIPELKDKTFRLMIDDGLHELPACKIFFENSIHKLEKGGVYIVEDIGVGNVVYPYVQQAMEWRQKYPDLLFWFFFCEPVELKTKENYMLICQRI